MNKINEVKEIKDNLQVDTTECELLKIQVNDINSKEIEISGRLDVSTSFCTMRVMKDSTFQFIDKITENGLYTVDVIGFNSIKISTSGTVSGYISTVLK